MQYDRIIDKAKKLGLNTDNIETKEAKVKAIAGALNFKNFNIDKDLNTLETKLDNNIYEKEKEAKINQVEDLYDNFHKIRKNTEDDDYVENDNNNTEDINEDDDYEEHQTPRKIKNEEDNYDDLERNANNRENRISNIKDKLKNTPSSVKPNVPVSSAGTGAASVTGAGAAAGAGTAAGAGAAATGTTAAGAATASAGAAATGGIAAAIAPALPVILIIVGILLLIIIIVIIFIKLNDNVSNSYINSCDGMSLSQTSLNKSEFVEKLTAYYAESERPGAKIFIDNAETIYELSTNNGINPELVVIRANREGFSPSGNADALSSNPSLAEYYNYWGLGCNNTINSLSECSNYESFEDGLLGFINNLLDHGYVTVSDMMSKYSSIGEFWYNPGNSGLGGCYYFDYMKEYMSEDRVKIVENACSLGNKCEKNANENCVKTTDEDKKAYTKYQVSKMVADRETIFGIPADVCNLNAEGCTIYGQNDPRWNQLPLGRGNTGTLMGSYGCAVTSLAIAISCSGTEVTIPNFDAGEFVKALNQYGCFDSSGQINWRCAGIQEVAPNITFIDSFDTREKSDAQIINEVNSYDPNQYFVLLHYFNNEHKKGHFVVYTSTSGKYFTVKDPASGGIVNNILVSDVVAYKVFSYKGVDNGQE